MVHIIITILVLIIFLLTAVIHGLSESIREEDERNRAFYKKIREQYDLKIGEYRKDIEVLEEIINGYKAMEGNNGK